MTKITTGLVNEIASMDRLAQAQQTVIDAELILLKVETEHCKRNPRQ